MSKALADMPTVLNALKIIGAALFLASIFFFWRSSYELFYLTAIYGRQNLFFSLMHIGPMWRIEMLFVSQYAYLAFALYSAVVSLLGFWSAFREHARFIKIVRIAFIVFGCHYLALITYSRWVSFLFD